MKTTMKQIQFNTYGSPEVLKLSETDIPKPGQAEVLVKVKAVGVNFSDILRRKNHYFQDTPLPFILGTEAVGEIAELGPDVGAPFSTGIKVLAILPSAGGYSEYVIAMAQYCVPIPKGIDLEQATAIFVQGTTAQLMMSELAGELTGKTVLINGAAGGVGSLLLQLAKLKGARVIAGIGSVNKLKFCKGLGADEVINYSERNWSKEVRALTDGQGVDVIFEMVGGDVYNESLDVLIDGGRIIIYGCASGVQGQVYAEYFVDRNITQYGFNLAYYIANYMEKWQKALESIMELLMHNDLKVNVSYKFSLEKAWKAHQSIENRETMGKVILTVNH